MRNYRVVPTLIELRLVLVTLAAAGLLAAGCDGEDEDGENGDEAPAVTRPGAEEAASLQQEIADLSAEEQIERIGEAWAEPFAAGDETMCGYFHRDAASPCTVYVQGGSSKLQKSFAGTTVENVKFTRGLFFRAIADFSNGEQVTFSQDPDRAWKVFKVPSAGSG